jgi:hypothetical protein
MMNFLCGLDIFCNTEDTGNRLHDSYSDDAEDGNTVAYSAKYGSSKLEKQSSMGKESSAFSSAQTQNGNGNSNGMNGFAGAGNKEIVNMGRSQGTAKITLSAEKVVLPDKSIK